MNEQITLKLNCGTIVPQITYSKRKSIGIRISDEGTVKVRAPYFTSRTWIEKLLWEKRDWIETTLLKIEAKKEHHIPEFSQAEIKEYRKEARKLLLQKAEYFGRLMEVSHGRITIKDQRTCWGSCSARGNLNFNWRLILMPEEILDYVVVHELAHLKQLNHSPKFWSIVGEILPDYKVRRKWLKENGGYFIRQTKIS